MGKNLMLVTSGLLLIVSVVVSANAVPKDQEKILGKWKVVSVEEDGKPNDDFKDAVISMVDGKYTIKFADGESFGGTYKLDPSQKPKAIDFVPNFGRNKGKTVEGIYLLEGETLKFCRSDAGKGRPKEFVTKPDTGLMIFVLKKAKR
jgi:uncharacterized protein (TIGR03067 family)